MEAESEATRSGQVTRCHGLGIGCVGEFAPQIPGAPREGVLRPAAGDALLLPRRNSKGSGDD